jgi:hypothetical protein
LLGLGNVPSDPTLGIREAMWRATVPVDVRQMGEWFRAFLAPANAAGAQQASNNYYPSGWFTFSALPVANSTITVGTSPGQAFTFVASGPTTNQILIGATIAATIDNAVTVLNNSVVAAVIPATYSRVGDNVLFVRHDTLADAGSGFVLNSSPSPASNATRNAANLEDAITHYFVSRRDASYPTLTIEKNMPQLSVAAQRFVQVVGLHPETLSLAWDANTRPTCDVSFMGLSETVSAATSDSDGVDAAYTIARYVGCSGTVTRNGSAFGALQSASLQLGTGLAREDIIGTNCQPFPLVFGRPTLTGSMTVRLANRDMLAEAEAGTPMAMTLGWANGPRSITLTIPRIFLSKPSVSVAGPGGVLVSFDWQASGGDAGASDLMTVSMTNDVENYYA